MSLWRHRDDRYSTLSIGLHWLMMLLIVAVYVCMQASDQYPRDSDMRALMRHWHYMLGLSVLGLVALRLLLRWPHVRVAGRKHVVNISRWASLGQREGHGSGMLGIQASAIS